MSTYRSGLAQVLSLVDSKTGVIREVRIFSNVADDPAVYCAVATPASLGPMLGFDFENNGAACAEDEAGAVMRACGETIERYSAAFIDRSRLVWKTSAELREAGERVFEVNDFYPFAGDQIAEQGFPFSGSEPGHSRFWVPVTPLAGGKPAMVPASCVFLPYCFPDEYVTHAPISTGMAAGFSREDCIEKGAAEIVERDALMIRWKCALPAPSIDTVSIAAASPELDRLMASTAHIPGRWWFSLLTLDIEIPVVSAAFINHDGMPLTSFGIASASSVVDALGSAIREALLSRFLLNRTKLSPLEPSGTQASFRTLRDHLFGHAASEELRDHFLDLFGEQRQAVDANHLIARFSGRTSVAQAVIDAGLDLLYADVTSADVRNAGIEVWRVLVPHAEPLDNDHLCQYLGGKRLHRFLQESGNPAFNPVPHPFP